MTINHIYNTINNAMKLMEDIDLMSFNKRKYNQMKLNKAYQVLDDFRDELIRENIRNKQKEAQKI